MSWYTEGFEAAEAAASSGGNRSKNHNFWTKPDEIATVRFLSPAKKTFNIKRAFVPGAKGMKYFTSPMVDPDPFVEAGYQLQNTFIWKVLDRRVIQYTDRSNKDQSIEPRVLYFAIGQRDRKALLAFEAQMLADYNEELVDAGKAPVTEDAYNIGSYDLKLSKGNKAPWQFHPVRRGKPAALTAEDLKIIEDSDFDLAEELKPQPLAQIQRMLAEIKATTAQTSSSEGASYSYDAGEEVEQPTFFGK